MTIYSSNYSSINNKSEALPNKLLDKIENRLLDETSRLPGNFYIYGDPHIGKTKLLRKLYVDIQQGGQLAERFIPFWIDLELLPVYNEFVFWRFLIDKLFAEITEQAKDQKMTKQANSDDFLVQLRNLQTEYNKIAGLEDPDERLYLLRQVYADSLMLLKFTTNKKILLFIDNFQVITNEFEIDDLKSVLSKMHGDYEREEQPLRYIICSLDSLDELRRRQKEKPSKSSFVPLEIEYRIRATGYSKFIGIFTPEIIKPLTKDEAEDYIRTFLPSFRSSEQIYEITGGLPYFIEFVCDQIIESMSPNITTMETSILENLKLKVSNHIFIIDRLELLWLKLKSTPVLIDILHFVNSRKEEFVPFKEIQKAFSDGYVEGLLTNLSDSGWIVEEESGYRISTFLMQSFVDRKSNEVQKNKSAVASPIDRWNEVSSAKILLERENEAILRGKRISLTELEYKLLKSLANNPNQALTREELSRKLWGKDTILDQKTRANLDQIVKRLRKKIETDTSSPEIIQSVRNSGYIARI